MVAKFLDLGRDGHLHFQTMEKSMGYRFAPKYNHVPRKDCIYVTFMPYLQDLGLLRPRNFATMATRRNDVSPYQKGSLSFPRAFASIQPEQVQCYNYQNYWGEDKTWTRGPWTPTGGVMLRF